MHIFCEYLSLSKLQQELLESDGEIPELKTFHFKSPPNSKVGKSINFVMILTNATVANLRFSYLTQVIW
jgi:hypothetical protein